jgi:uncharacterized protein
LASTEVSSAEKTVCFLPTPEVDALKNMSTFVIELTRGCNLRCHYCCYSGQYAHNRIHQDNKSLSSAQISEIYEFIATHCVPGRPLSLCYYGGEPFTQKDLLKEAIELARIRFEADTQYTISTNLTCLTERDVRWCIEQGVTLNVSIDGSKTIHNRNRVYENGGGSYDAVYRNLVLIESLDAPYFYNHINLLVTLTDLQDLMSMAEFWGQDMLLKGKAPYLISGLAPNYPNVAIVNEQEVQSVLYKLMDYYEHHRDNLFAKAYFEQLTSPILDRNIYPQEDAISPLVCLPYNQRCFIDANLQVGICEKTSDELRIGTIHGFDFHKINHLISEISQIKQTRCASCEIQRLCQMCFTNYHLTSTDWDIYCKRQLSWTKISLQMTCEMAERGLYDSDEAKGCHLRPLTPGDATALFHMMSNPKVVEYIDGIEPFQTRSDAERFLRLFDRDERNVPSLLYGIEHTGKGLIGLVGFDQIDCMGNKDSISPEVDANLLFILDEGYWHKGIMTTMLSQFLSSKVSQAHLSAVPRLVINRNNEQARRLAERFASCKSSITAECCA